jgi:hypothetical protein
LILDIKDELLKNSEHLNKVSELKDMGKREAELSYKEQFNERQAIFKSEIKNLKEQYEHLID